MERIEPRPGRGRRYDIRPVLGFADPAIGYAVAVLDELSERLFDLIADLPQDALDSIPQGTTNSIAMLVVHMAWAEANWVSQATGYPAPAGLVERLLPGQQGASGDLAISSASVGELIGCCQAVRRSLTEPALSSIDSIDQVTYAGGELATLRQVLMHVVWHWIYHSGQVGLLHRLWGCTRYRWTFERGGGDALLASP